MSALDGKRALVAEDDPIQGRLVAQALQKAGATVEIVRDGKAARDLLGRTAYDVFVTDWMMPEVDGIELARQLRSVPNRPFVVLVSALSLPDAKAHALSAGADEFFAKPMVAPKLVEAVAKGIARRAMPGFSAATENAARPKAPIDHPVARTQAWKALPETIRKVVGELLQVSTKLFPLDAMPAGPAVHSLLPLVDTEHLMELHLRIETSRSDAIEVARLMLGDPPPDDDETLTDVIAEVANVASGAIKTAFVAEGFPFTMGIATRSEERSPSDNAVSEFMGLRAERVALSLAFDVRPRNAVIVAASRLR